MNLSLTGFVALGKVLSISMPQFYHLPKIDIVGVSILITKRLKIYRSLSAWHMTETFIYIHITYTHICTVDLHKFNNHSYIYIHMNIYTFNRSYYNYYHSWHIHSIGAVKIIITQGQGKQKGWHLVEKCRKLRIARNSGHQPIMSAGLEHVTTYNRISYISFFPFFFVVMERVKSRASHMLGQCFSLEPLYQPFFVAEFCYVAQTNL